MSKINNSQEIWNKVADKLGLSGFSGIEFKVLSKPGEPFEVEVTGSKQSIDSVISSSFRDHLKKILRDEIINTAGGMFITVGEDPNWPMFKLLRDGQFVEEDDKMVESFTPKSSVFEDPEDYESRKKRLKRIVEEPTLDELRGIGKRVMGGVPEKKNRERKRPVNDEPEEVHVISRASIDGSNEVHVPDMERLKEIANEIANLVKKKNKAYGNSFNTVSMAMALLYPNEVKPEQMQNVFYLLRIWDKMMRIATNPGAFSENPYNDIIGYSLLAAERYESEK